MDKKEPKLHTTLQLLLNFANIDIATELIGVSINYTHILCWYCSLLLPWPLTRGELESVVSLVRKKKKTVLWSLQWGLSEALLWSWQRELRSYVHTCIVEPVPKSGLYSFVYNSTVYSNIWAQITYPCAPRSLHKRSQFVKALLTRQPCWHSLRKP